MAIDWSHYANTQLLLKNSELPSTIEPFNTAIRLTPTFSLAYSAPGRIYLEGGQFSEALTDFEKA